VFLQSSIVEGYKELEGVRAKGSGDITTTDVQTLLEAFLITSLRSACFTDEDLFW
jgi:hypothetical protein